MQTYTFFFLNAAGERPVFEFEDCADHAAAHAKARELLRKRPDRHGVEVWDQAGRIARVEESREAGVESLSRRRLLRRP